MYNRVVQQSWFVWCAFLFSEGIFLKDKYIIQLFILLAKYHMQTKLFTF